MVGLSTNTANQLLLVLNALVFQDLLPIEYIETQEVEGVTEEHRLDLLVEGA